MPNRYQIKKAKAYRQAVLLLAAAQSGYAHDHNSRYKLVANDR